MFQENHGSFDINFDDKEIDANDFLLCYKNKALLCRFVEQRVCLPKACDVKGEIKSVFAFSVEDKRYFLALDEIAAEGFEFFGLNLLKGIIEDNSSFAAITGFHYHAFHSENKFCTICAKRLFHNPKKRCMICEGCQNEVFPKISPAIIVGVIDNQNDSILLTKYAGGDYKKFALVAGFIEMGESAEQAAVREAMEETGIQITDLEYYGSQPWGFAQNLLLGYFAKVKGSREIHLDQTELAQAVWVSRSDVEAYPDRMSLTNQMMWAFKSGEV